MHVEILTPISTGLSKAGEAAAASVGVAVQDNVSQASTSTSGLSRNQKKNKRKTERNQEGRAIARSCIASMVKGDNYCGKVVLVVDSKLDNQTCMIHIEHPTASVRLVGRLQLPPSSHPDEILQMYERVSVRVLGTCPRDPS